MWVPGWLRPLWPRHSPRGEFSSLCPTDLGAYFLPSAIFEDVGILSSTVEQAGLVRDTQQCRPSRGRTCESGPRPAGGLSLCCPSSCPSCTAAAVHMIFMNSSKECPCFKRWCMLSFTPWGCCEDLGLRMTGRWGPVS